MPTTVKEAQVLSLSTSHSTALKLTLALAFSTPQPLPACSYFASCIICCRRLRATAIICRFIYFGCRLPTVVWPSHHRRRNNTSARRLLDMCNCCNCCYDSVFIIALAFLLLLLLLLLLFWLLTFIAIVGWLRGLAKKLRFAIPSVDLSIYCVSSTARTAGRFELPFGIGWCCTVFALGNMSLNTPN